MQRPNTYRENDAPLNIAAGLVLFERGVATLHSAVVYVKSGFAAGQDVLAFTPAYGISGIFDGSTGRLTLTGPATLAQYQEVLRSVTYTNSSEDPSGHSRAFEILVDDGAPAGAFNSALGTRLRLKAVNDAPHLTVDATLVYASPQAAQAVDSTLALTDPDSEMRAAVVRIGEGYVRGEDVLAATALHGIRVRFDAGRGELKLTGTATADEYQEVLRSVTYTNSSVSPSLATRTVEILVKDKDHSDGHQYSNLAVVSVIFAGPPVISTSAAPLAYTEGDAALPLSPTIAVADPDNANLASATVRISSGFQPGDALLFTDTANITGDFNNATGVLTLSGSATVAEYQGLLRTVRFVSTSETPGTGRTITWIANDGSGDSAAATTTIAVTPVNGAPALATDASLAFTENGAPAFLAPTATVVDVDSADFNGGSLVVGFNANGTTADQLTIVDQGAASGQIGASAGNITYEGASIGTYTGGANGAPLSIAFNSAAATPEAIQALVRDITFANTSDNPSTLPRTVRFTLSDGDGGAQTVTSDITVNVTDVNDAPTVATSGNSTAYTEAAGPVAVDSSVTISDLDSSTFTSAKIQITNGFLTGKDFLAFSGSGATGNIAAGTFDAASGTLTLISSGGTATTAQWQAALQAVKFDTTSTSPGVLRTVEFQLDDGQASHNLSPVATHTIAITEVNSRPTVTTTGGSAAFAEDTGGPIAVDSAIAVADPDSTNLVGATVRISTGFKAGQDVLDFTATSNIGGSFNATTGALTLKGDGTLAEYRAALASVTYDNTSDAPDTAARTLEFQVDDGQSVSNLSTAATRTVTVTATNDAPSITVDAAFAYTENGPAAPIAPAASVGDVDSTDFNGGTLEVSFTAGGTVDDQLGIANQGTGAGQIGAAAGALTFGGVAIGTYTSGASGLGISFGSAAATPAAVQALVRAVTFANTSNDPSTLARTVDFSLADGDGGSQSSTTTVNVTTVNDVPTVTGSKATALAYTENDAPTVIDGGITLTDADSTTLAGAAISITGNFVSGQDLLAFTAAGGIKGNYNPGTGVLTLSGSDTVKNYEAALHSVTYANSSEDPSSATRTVSIQVSDGTDAGNVITRDIGVASVNDAPTVTAGTSISYTENAVAQAVSSSLTISDAEGDTIASAKASITGNFASGQDTLSFTPAGSITGSYNAGTGVLSLSGNATAAQYQSVLQSVSYSNSSDAPSTAVRTVSFQATDSHGDAGIAATASVSITAVNDAPVTVVPANAAVGTAFSNTALSITGVSVSDVDSGTADVQATVSAANGALTFSLGGGALATGNGTGSVVLTGTVAQVNNALATLSYKSADGFTGADTVSVITSDLGHTGSGGAQLSNGGIASAFQVGVVPQVFVIDNSTSVPDTASAGSPANPFNSIASFNALAGDGTGDYIYVNKGLGTYSEADGFNLQTGQHLVGQGQTLQFTNPVNGNVVTIGTSAAGTTPTLSLTGAGAHGVDLATGNFITGLNIATTLGNQTGISDGGGTVGTLNVSDVDVTGAGMAVDIDQGGALNVTIDNLTSTGSTQQGVQLAGVALTGTFTATKGSIDGSSGTAFLVGDGAGTAGTGGTAAINFGGTISGTGVRTVDIQDRAASAGNINLSGDIGHSGAAGGIVIDDIASGTINFSGSVDIGTTTAAGITLSDVGSGVNFTGGALTINTTTGIGISGTTVSSLTVLGSGNSIASSSAAALNLNGVTIGASGLNFTSVSSSGAANGIVLNNTGSSGSLTVTGNGAPNSGGTVQSTTGDGIVVTSGAINLNYMLVKNTAGDGILATNLLGTNSVNNSTITGFGTGGTHTNNGLTVVNNNSNLSSLTVSDTVFSNGSAGNDGIFMEAQGSSNMLLKVLDSTFTGLYGDGVQVSGTSSATGTVRVTISNSDFTNAVALDGNGGISLTPFGGINFFADVDGNTLSGIMNAVNNLGAIGVTNGDPNSAGTLTSNADITIRNNTISSIAGGRGITITADGGTTDLAIDNNTIDSLGSNSKPAINVNFTNNPTAGTVASGNAIISNNDIGQHGQLWTSQDGSASAILVLTQSSATLNSSIVNNTIDANTGTVAEVVRVRAIGTSVLNATVTGNDIQDTGTPNHVEFDATAGSGATAAGTINLNFTGNTLYAGGVIQLTQNTNGTINVMQASAAALGTANANATVSEKPIGAPAPAYGQGTPTAPTTPSLPLHAHDDAGPGNGGTLALADLGSIAAAAVQRWESLPLGNEQHALLDNLTFGLADMSGTLLGTSVSGSLVLIDLDAAGHGWYVDASPLDDAEFSAITATHLVAPPDAAAGRLDLLTAVMHEIGHALGLDDDLTPAGEHSLMYGYLDSGERRLPGQADLLTLVGVGPAGEV